MATYDFSTQKELFEIAYAILVAFDHFIDAYRDFYEEVGSYTVYELNRDEIMKFLGKDLITYRDILGLSRNNILKDEGK